MKYVSLDSIVCSVLLRRGYSAHWYFQFLKHASDCLRELNMSTLGNIKTVKLPLNSYKAVSLPSDFVDYVKIGVPVGQFIRPLASRAGLSRLNNYDDNSQKILHDAPSVLDVNGGWTGFWYHNTINSNGEHLGRAYGSGGNNRTDTFKVLRERGEIQFNEQITCDEILLEYISSGMTTDNATKIHPYAQSTIEAYIIWQHKDSNRSTPRSEVADEERKFYNQWRHLRARMADWTVTDIIRIIRSQYQMKG